MHINGACHCGTIAFKADIDPGRVLACHCTDCQTLSGAPLRAVVTVPIERFSVSGTPKAYGKVADSGNRRAQMFCPACGTNLYACAAENPTWVSIRLGSVAEGQHRVGERRSGGALARREADTEFEDAGTCRS